MSGPTPFQIDVPESVLSDIAARVQAFPWHEEPDGGGWDYGANLTFMRDLAAYWVDHFDWRKAERALNAYPQFKADVDGINLHFYHVTAGRDAGRRPAILLSHGWPGSVFEFLGVIDALSGGADGCDLVIPSLPGYGWSGRPAKPIGPRRIGEILSSLMTNTLGYDRYVAQGGDWGAAISTWIGIDDPDHCAGIHINMMGVSPAERPESDAEKAWSKIARRTFADGSGYFRQQATRPQTLSYAMMDSPIGVAAWITEKFRAWSDLGSGDLDSCYSKDTLLTNIMIYLVTRSFNTASWLYRGYWDEKSGTLPLGVKVKLPTAAAVFPKDLVPWPPRSHVEKAYSISQWTEMKSGGHFAALERPDWLVADIQKFVASLQW